MTYNHIKYFNQIKEEVTNGSDINYLNNGVSYVSGFLDIYYDDIYADAERDKFALILQDELKDRNKELLEILDWFCKNKADLNAGEELPLMLAVGNADAPMVEYLILQGANIYYTPYDNSGIPESNWYMEDLDVQAMDVNPEDEQYRNAILNTARVLAQNCVTENSFYCIKINENDRTIRMANGQVKY